MPLSDEIYLKEKLGIINKTHCMLIDMNKNIQEQIDAILNNPNIHLIRKCGQDYAKQYLNSENKFKELLEILLINDKHFMLYSGSL